MNASLQNDVRQLFSHSVLNRFSRLEEANVGFTFDTADVYLSAFAEAMDALKQTQFAESDPNLVQYARVFERFIVDPVDCVSPRSAAIVAASLYWLSGYTANAMVVARLLQLQGNHIDSASACLLAVLSRDPRYLQAEAGDPLAVSLRAYLLSGTRSDLYAALRASRLLRRVAFDNGVAAEYVAARLLQKVLLRLSRISLWAAVEGRASAPAESWRTYAQDQLGIDTPLIDIWPSQRTAIRKGLLDGASSLVLQMPTSAGKTKMTELMFVNDLYSDPDRRCLYLAPFRALVSEVENQIGGTLSRLGFSVASLYGGSDANEVEAEVCRVARVVIATPEKISAVLRLSGGSLTEFGTIVLDEGHLLDSRSRGAAYELQLASLRTALAQHPRTAFLSAVLPNAQEIAEWLGGMPDCLATDDWQPTTFRVGLVRWVAGVARLDYQVGTGQALTERFFVPRLLEQDQWQELNPSTGRFNQKVFPGSDKASLCAALAFRYSEVGPVIIYAQQPRWAEAVARSAVDRLSGGRETTSHLIDDDNRDQLAAIADYLRRLMGDESVLPDAVALGVAFHHGGLPQSARLVIEDEFRKQTIRLLIATNTLAQGVNLPAKTVIVHSFPNTDASVRDFWNLMGRAGRAARETEGEVVVLPPTHNAARTLRRFLDRGNMETAYSTILSFVTDLLRRYPRISCDVLEALEETGEAHWRDCIRAIDVHLLELMAEDIDADEVARREAALTESLLATAQAARIDARDGSHIQAGVADLIHVRCETVMQQVPDPATRRRFSKAGIGISSCLRLDQAARAVYEIVVTAPELTDDGFDTILRVACDTEELGDADPDTLIPLARHWVNLGSYGDIFRLGRDTFRDFAQAVRYTEDTISYRTPWVLNGLLRTLQGTDTGHELLEAVEFPVWLRFLPSMLHFGVPSRELVWAMSLGVQDRQLAAWLVDRFNADERRSPGSFRDLLSWAIRTRETVCAELPGFMPVYFCRMYSDILNRYAHLAHVLGAE